MPHLWYLFAIPPAEPSDLEDAMTKLSMVAALAVGILLFQGCGQRKDTATESPAKSETASVAATPPGLVEIQAVGKTFVGPSTIPSGWTTFRFVNASSMIHFAMIDVPPPGITTEIFTNTVGQYFQDAMDALNAGDDAGVKAAFARFPDWIGDLARHGGPGLLSPGRTGQTTVYLEPGHYFLECYVKSNGIFHTTSPGDGKVGMMLDLVVTDEKNGAPEPTANATLAVRNSGMELVSGTLVPGTNTIRVDFIEQQALPSFVGNDVHLMRVDDAESLHKANAWLDWRARDGLEDPSPVTFLGGINDLPAGSHGYFTVELEPGDYAFIAEMPDPMASGFVWPFKVETVD
jgi:hypothetical protein